MRIPATRNHTKTRSKSAYQPMSYWKAPSADREGKRVAASPSWSGLAGTPGSFLDTGEDRRGRAERAKKRKLFGDSSSEDAEEPRPDEEDGEESDEEDDEEEEQEENQSIVRLILEAHPLKCLLERNIRCKKCGSRVLVKYTTLTVSSFMSVHCASKKCSFIDYMDSPQAAQVKLPAGSRNLPRNTDHAINILYVLSFLMSGDGGKEAARVLGLLGLPNDTTMESRTFPTIERRIGPTIRLLTDEIMLENLHDEVEAVQKKQGTYNKDIFELWKRSTSANSTVDFPIGLYPEVVVSADFAWNTRGGGNAYNSNSGFGCLVGGETRKPVLSSVKSKYCRACSLGVALDAHECLKNHDGSSKAMEPKAISEMFMQLFEQFHCLAVFVVTDDDSTVKSRLKYSHEAWLEMNNTTQARRIYSVDGKSYKLAPKLGVIPTTVPKEPGFYADPNHRKKTLRNELTALAKATNGKNVTMTRCDAIRISHNFGYFCRTLKNLQEEEYKAAAASVLDHHFDKHDQCGPWCRRKNETAAERAESAKYYRDMKEDAKLYCKLQELLSRYFTMKALRECAHGYDTQVNESINNSVAWLAPKNKMYCASHSLHNRIAVAIGVTSVGLLPYHVRLFKKLGITMTSETLHFLTVKDRKRARKQAIAKTKEAKLKRQAKKADGLKVYTATAKREKAQRAGTYESGVAMDDGYDPELLTDAQKKIECRHCARLGHKTRMNKLCPQYVPRKRKAKAAALPEQEDDAFDADRMDRLAINDAVDSDDEFFDAFQQAPEEQSDGEEDPYRTAQI